ncbi:MAG: hypothetical protein JWP36_466 [Paucimonas sp.]|nr:hypothetical protein [Paucimonas sp.]
MALAANSFTANLLLRIFYCGFLLRLPAQPGPRPSNLLYLAELEFDWRRASEDRDRDAYA